MHLFQKDELSLLKRIERCEELVPLQPLMSHCFYCMVQLFKVELASVQYKLGSPQQSLPNRINMELYNVSEFTCQ